MKNENKKLRAEALRLFLLGFFNDEPKNEVKKLNGMILFKHWDGDKNDWTVQLFTPESYERMMTRTSVGDNVNQMRII